MARYLGGLTAIAVIVAGLALPAAARDFGGQGSFGGRVPQFSGGRPDAHFFVGRPNEHFLRDQRPIFLDRRRHIFVSPRVVTFDRFGRPFYPYWAWPYWADVPPGWLYGPTQVAASGPVDTGDTVTPTASRNCRQFRTTMIIEGRSEPVQGRACQWLDGSWHAVP